MPLILITGASQGIGAAMALAFATEIQDARLVLVARSADKLNAVARRCRLAGAEAEVIPCDLAYDDAVAHMAATVQKRLGVPDVLINNAGSFAPGGVLEMSPTDFREQIDVNLVSAFLVTHAFLPGMVERGSGDVFFSASVASILGYPRSVAYGAAKHGLLGLARALRAETREKGIRVIALIPGATYTESWSGSELPEERFMPPEDVARLAVTIHQMTDRTVVEEVLLRPQLGDI